MSLAAAGLIREGELHHSAGFVNEYEASKYAAEVELRSRMRDLPIGICRISTAVGDS
jgi:thioester reductase-like protein